uniref:DUF659 domain-containing protein n=1 Tax=Fagus sylvatica TaxID=28930 RepID=A0A2N9FKN2_FAGSY
MEGAIVDLRTSGKPATRGLPSLWLMENTTSSGFGTSMPDGNAPLWTYVTKIEKSSGGGGSMSFKCNYCQEIYKDPQRRPLINFIATSEGAPGSLKAIDGTKEYKDKYYISELLMNVIKEIGLEKVVQVITDNAYVMKVAGSLIEADWEDPYGGAGMLEIASLTLDELELEEEIMGATSETVGGSALTDSESVGDRDDEEDVVLG